MLIVSWNIQFGGRNRLTAIAEELIRRSPDIIVLGEHMTATTPPLLEQLGEAGWVHRAVTEPPERWGGVAVLSKHDLIVRPLPPGLESFGFRYQAVGVPALDLEVRGIYAPLENKECHDFWESALAALGSESGMPVLVVGDLNTGSGGIDSPSPRVPSEKYFRQIHERGFIDLWRQVHGAEAKEHTWEGTVNPYRLDHAFGSPAVSRRLVSCSYDHPVREAELSDHSLLSVELRP